MTLHPSITADESFTRTTITQDASEAWPPEPRVVRHVLADPLAERVRNRLGAATDDTVTLDETTTYGGYSAWTQENATEFTVRAGVQERSFYPRGAADWRDDAPDASAHSIYARFDAWLRAAEDPAALFAEWFTFHEEAGRIVQYRSNPDTVLTTAAREHQHGTKHLTLTGTSDGTTGREWQLDLVAAPDSSGFRRVLSRATVAYTVGLTLNPDVTRELLTVITDDLMPGREW
jgi:hypothetical protein